MIKKRAPKKVAKKSAKKSTKRITRKNSRKAKGEWSFSEALQGIAGKITQRSAERKQQQQEKKRRWEHSQHLKEMSGLTKHKSGYNKGYATWQLPAHPGSSLEKLRRQQAYAEYQANREEDKARALQEKRQQLADVLRQESLKREAQSRGLSQAALERSISRQRGKVAKQQAYDYSNRWVAVGHKEYEAEQRRRERQSEHDKNVHDLKRRGLIDW